MLVGTGVSVVTQTFAAALVSGIWPSLYRAVRDPRTQRKKFSERRIARALVLNLFPGFVATTVLRFPDAKIAGIREGSLHGTFPVLVARSTITRGRNV